MKEQIAQAIARALTQLDYPQLDAIHIEQTRDKKFGDYACNAAMVLAKHLSLPPRELAQQIVNAIAGNKLIERIDIAGPGFINFFLNSEAQLSVIDTILAEKNRYGLSDYGAGQRVHMEIVSANPTGPLHVGHGRLAAVGSVCADLLEGIGYTVHREYYVNDAGRQMDILATSVWLRYLQQQHPTLVFPENAYRGDYIVDIAADFTRRVGEQHQHPLETVFQNVPADEPAGGDKEAHIDGLIERAKTLLGAAAWNGLHRLASAAVLADIREDLNAFGVTIKNWYSEQTLHDSGAIDASLTALDQQQFLYEKGGALWLKTSEFGDDEDRVVRRQNGQPTYFAPDIAYHHEKFSRGFDWIIDEMGSDHHGYVPRLKAAMTMLGHDAEKLSVLFIQFVNLYRDGEKVSMSTRKGSFVTLRELRTEVGNDAARFFYIMRKAEQHLDFDLSLAKSQSNDNPVYYIQYAHARICSVMSQLAERGWQWDERLGAANLTLLTTTQEVDLLQHLAIFPEIVQQAALKHEPHQLTQYLRELAHCFHSYYNAQQFLSDAADLRNARLCLIVACRQVLRNGLALLNISAPDTM